jgi:hypothetical protein
VKKPVDIDRISAELTMAELAICFFDLYRLA